MKFTALLALSFLVSVFGSSFGFAADSSDEPQPPTHKNQFEIGAYTGTLLLSNIPQVIDNVPPVMLKLGFNSKAGSFEASILHARGNDMRWRSGLIDYRFDLDDLQLPFHALFGFQVDAYQIYDGQQEYYAGGWHYGGGAHFEIIPHLIFRADFVNRFGPGRSLLVVVGLSVGLGDFDSSQK